MKALWPIKRMKIRNPLRLATLGFAAVCLVLASTPYVAANNNVVHTSNILHQEVSTFPVPDLVCTAGPGTMTLVTNAQFHILEFVSGPQAGRFHLTRTQHSDFEFVPDAPGAPTYTGSITSTTSINSNNPTLVETLVFNINGLGSDGSHFNGQLKEHVTITPNGITSDFFELNCH